MHVTRRDFSTGLLAGLALPGFLSARALTARGVELGLQTFTFHQLREGGPAAVDTMIAAMKQLNVTIAEIYAPQLNPFPMPAGYYRPYGTADERTTPATRPTPEESKAAREKLRDFRTNTPPDYFPAIRRKFSAAGIRIFAYNYTFEPSMTDAEIDWGFDQARALGTNLITASSRVSMAQRVVPFAEKHKMQVAYHGHSEIDDPDQVASPESFMKVMAMSKWYRINLDIAHYAAADIDPVPFLKAHHADIVNLHVHDRKGHNGASVPMGQGVAPVRDVLLLLRDNHWNIPVFYELEYPSNRSVVEETAAELAYEKKVLES